MPDTLELFLIGCRFFLPITEPSLSSELPCWFFTTSGDEECDFFDATLFGLAELDFDLLLLDEALLRFVERLAWDESLLPVATDWLDVTEPAGVAERPDTADAALEALLFGDGDRDPAGDFEGLLDGDLECPEPDGLLEQDLDAWEVGEVGEADARDEGEVGDLGEPGSDPDGELARTGEADLDDWLLLFADEELDTDSESLASGQSKSNTKWLIHTRRSINQLLYKP